MTMTWWRVAVAGGALAAVVSVPQARVQEVVTLAVPGRANAAPWVAADGRFVAVAWGAEAGGKHDVFVATSADGGGTFTAPVRVNAVAGDARISGEIPPRVAVVRKAGATAPEVVVAWNAKDQGTEIRVARSRDGGRTFAAPQSLQKHGAAGDRGWHALTLDSGGVAHVIWLDHRGLAAAKEGAMDHHTAHDGVAMAQKSGLYYASVGERAAAERELTPGVCYCCKSAIVALDGGRLVSAWRHVYPGNLRDIAFTISGDGGRTFASPKRVSEDGWSIDGCPDDGPALAAGADQSVHVVWPTVIPGDTPTGAIFYAALNGEGAFGARTRVPTLGGPKPSHPQVVVERSGRLLVAWDESANGIRTAAYVAATRGEDGAVRFSAPVRFQPSGVSAYPVMAPLARGAVAVWTSGARETSTIAVRRLD